VEAFGKRKSILTDAQCLVLSVVARPAPVRVRKKKNEMMKQISMIIALYVLSWPGQHLFVKNEKE